MSNIISAPGESLQSVAEKLCQHLPEGFEARLCMENGSAWVELSDDFGNGLALPESADKTLIQQLNDAIYVSRAWAELPTQEQGK